VSSGGVVGRPAECYGGREELFGGNVGGKNFGAKCKRMNLRRASISFYYY
jgi:hypothetical protein